MKKVKVALIGAGQRGKDIYGEYALNYPQRIEFVAVAEPNKIKREEFSRKHNIPKEFQFETWEEMLERDKFCDGVVIATPDNMHFGPGKLALEKDYHILMEKPMSKNPAEIMELGRLANEKQNVFLISHVLRYTPYFAKIKEIIDSGIIGEVQSIQHNENVGYYHFAHSFVRGNWNNSDKSSPLILQKSCHDMDILLWITGQNCKRIASFGSLGYFNKENKPEGEGRRFTDYPEEAEGPYSPHKLYYPNIGKWPTTAVTEIQTKEAVDKALEEGPYGLSIYGECDNNVVDHQATILEFDRGTTVTFNLSAFSAIDHRTTRVMGTLGDIIADDYLNEVQYRVFGEDKRTIINPKVITGGHGGGDTGLMNDFVSLILEGGEGLSSADKSVQSHMMALAAEEARLTGTVVNLKEYYKKF